MAQITVILPNYNKKHYVADCIASLLAQTYTDWHCWLIDGYSDDGSADYLRSLSQRDARFSFQSLPPTGNCYDAWNWGLRQVNTPYFAILTSDDRWHPQWLTQAINELQRYPKAIASASRVVTMNRQGQPTGETAIARRSHVLFSQSHPTRQYRSGQFSTVVAYFMGAIYTSFHSLVLRSDCLAQGLHFATDLGAIADYDSYLKLGLMGDFVYLPQITNLWRYYGQQLTGSLSPRQKWQYRQQIHRNLRPAITQSLGTAGEIFEAIAHPFCQTILPYAIQRPNLQRFFNAQLTSKLELIDIIRQYPREFCQDCLYRLQGKQLLLEAGAIAAERVKLAMETTLIPVEPSVPS